MAAEAVYSGQREARTSTMPGATGQLALYATAVARRGADPAAAKLCAGCRAREARYGFRDGERQERPRTLCFECFRMELDFRRQVAERMSRGWNARQAPLPLAATLDELSLRRRRAQIAARHAIAEPMAERSGEEAAD